MSAKLPTETHQLRGTRPTRAAEGTEPLPPGRPKYPKNCTPETKAAFKRLCSVLESRRNLTVGDGELLRLYAVIFDRHQRALEKLAAQGEVCVYTRLDSNGTAHDIEKTNYWLKIAEASEKNLVAILDRLGLTPLNRAKPKQTASEKPAAGAPEDPMAALVNGTKQKATWVMPPISEISEADIDFSTDGLSSDGVQQPAGSAEPSE